MAHIDPRGSICDACGHDVTTAPTCPTCGCSTTGGVMRLAVTFLGLDLLTVEIATSTDDVYEEPGDCLTQPIGFVAAHDRPDESGLPYREGWE